MKISEELVLKAKQAMFFIYSSSSIPKNLFNAPQYKELLVEFWAAGRAKKDDKRAPLLTVNELEKYIRCEFDIMMYLFKQFMKLAQDERK